MGDAKENGEMEKTVVRVDEVAQTRGSLVTFRHRLNYSPSWTVSSTSLR